MIIYNFVLYIKGFEGCSAHHFGCEHLCIHLWHGGHRCMCHKGYKLALDGRRCLKQDLCDAKSHHCDQICVSDDSLPRCKCRLGYVMNRKTNRCEGKFDNNKFQLGKIFCNRIDDDHCYNLLILLLFWWFESTMFLTENSNNSKNIARMPRK